MEKAERAQELSHALTSILNIHREAFPPAQRPVARAREVVGSEVIARALRKEAKKGVSVFDRKGRRAALSKAKLDAAAEHRRLVARADHDREIEQAHLDQIWGSLLSHDAATVLDELSGAFQDNEAAAAPIGVSGSSVSIVVHVPGIDDVPDHFPTTTAAGNLSIRKMSKTQRNDFYFEMVCGYLLVTAREAFAVSPMTTELSLVALRRSRPDSYGHVQAEAILTTSLQRRSLEGIRWEIASASQIISDAGRETSYVQKGAAKTLQPLSPADTPGVARVLELVDFDEHDGRR